MEELSATPEVDVDDSEGEAAGDGGAPDAAVAEVILQPVRMSFRRVSELCLDAGFRQAHQNDPDAVADALLRVKVARLEWQGFTEIDSLDALTAIQDLYLQHNLIRRIENLEFHKRLQYLSLRANLIERVENLSHLARLELLDLSENRIAVFDENDLPEQLRNLDLSGNDCTKTADYRERLRKRLPLLVVLDDERLVALGKGSRPASSDSIDQAGSPQAQQRSKSQRGAADALEDSEAMASARVGSGLEGANGDRARPGVAVEGKHHDGQEEGNAADEDEDIRQEALLCRSARSSKRPTSGLGRSDAMMEAAMSKIEAMSQRTSLRAKRAFARHREGIRERSEQRMNEQASAFEERAVLTVASTREGRPAAPASPAARA